MFYTFQQKKNGNSPVSKEMQIEGPVAFQEQVEKSKNNSKIKKKLKLQEMLSKLIQWNGLKRNRRIMLKSAIYVVTSYLQYMVLPKWRILLNCFTITVIYILCSKIATESLLYAIQKGRKYTAIYCPW